MALSLRDTMATLHEMKNEELPQYAIESLGYIEKMAHTLHIDISAWDIMKHFDDGTGKLLTGKREINKRLISAPVDYDNPVEFDLSKQDEMLFSLNKAINEITQTRIATLESHIQEERRRSNERMRQVQTSIRTMAEIRGEILTLKNTKPDYKSELQTIQNAGFWRLVDIDATRFIFVNRNNLILNERNNAAGLVYDVNMGRYTVTFDPSTLDLRATTFSDNIVVDGNYIHPYISQKGSICWGTAQDAASLALSKLELANVMALLATIMGTYVPSAHPYAALSTFRDKKELDDIAKRKKKAPPVIESELPF